MSMTHLTGYEWSEHILPDGTIYYSHSKLHVVTDIDLRLYKNFELLMNHLSDKPDEEYLQLPTGCELWLHASNSTDLQGFSARDTIIEIWIYHPERTAKAVRPGKHRVEPPARHEGKQIIYTASHEWLFLR